MCCSFQPLAWRLSRRIEATAEEVCDDHAVQFGADRQSYAELLVHLAERTMLVPPSVAVPLVTFRSFLARRVGRVLDHSRHLSLTVGLAALSLIIAAGLGGTLLTGLLGSSPQTAAAALQGAKDRRQNTEGGNWRAGSVSDRKAGAENGRRNGEGGKRRSQASLSWPSSRSRRQTCDQRESVLRPLDPRQSSR